MTDPVASPALLGVLDSERDRLPASLYEVGSMLSYHERGLLHWAARTAPPGAIVDLGSFLGGSTLALAAGAAGNDGIVDAFDRFRLEDDSQRAWIPAGFDLRPGDSTRDVFAHNTRRVADRVRKHEGEIEDQYSLIRSPSCSLILRNRGRPLTWCGAPSCRCSCQARS